MVKFPQIAFSLFSRNTTFEQFLLSPILNLRVYRNKHHQHLIFQLIFLIELGNDGLE